VVEGQDQQCLALLICYLEVSVSVTIGKFCIEILNASDIMLEVLNRNILPKTSLPLSLKIPIQTSLNQFLLGLQNF